MDIRFLNQPKDVKLGEVLTEQLEKGNFARVWIYVGFAKDSGLDYLYEAIKTARDSGTVVELILGLDKKNTSKDMLLRLLNLGCKIRYFLNGDDSKLETRIYAFESDDSESYIYLTGAKLSEDGLTENLSLITEIKYAKTEKKEFNKAKLNIESGASTSGFTVLNEDILKELASTGEILARITERKIPSISELYKSSEIDVGVQEYDESSSNNYNDLVNQDIDIDIDFSSGVQIQNSLGEEVEQKLKKSNKEEESKVISKLLLNEKEVDYETMNALIIQTNKVVKSGVTAGEIKISSAITSNMKKFFNYPEKFHMTKDEKGKLKETQEISLEIFENLSKYNEIDEKAVIIQNDKSTIIKSEKLASLGIEENNIIRLIRQDDSKYRCEVIKQDSPEYNIWESFCTVSVKGTSKKFGIS